MKLIAILLQTGSLFKHHDLAPRFGEPILRHQKSDIVWLSVIIILAMLLFGTVKMYNDKRLRLIVRAFFANNTFSQLLRDEISLANRVSLFIFLFFLIVLSLFVYLSASLMLPAEYVGAGMFFIVFALLLLVYTIKIFFARFLGHVFMAQADAGQYIINIFLYCGVLGMIMMPVVISMALMASVNPVVFMYMGLAIIVTLFIYRNFRSYLVSIGNRNISKTYLILYLCTLEILPMLLLVKFILKRIA